MDVLAAQAEFEGFRGPSSQGSGEDQSRCPRVEVMQEPANSVELFGGTRLAGRPRTCRPGPLTCRFDGGGGGI